MKKLIVTLGLVGFLGLLGCQETRYESSEILHEEAIVTDTVYTPKRHETTVTPTIDFDGFVGIDIDTDEIPEKYAVIFKCKHGGFISQGSDARHRTLYQRFQGIQGLDTNQVEAAVVDVTYKELYRLVYDDLDKDGRKELVSKTLLGYDFLDARLKTAALSLENKE